MKSLRHPLVLLAGAACCYAGIPGVARAAGQWDWIVAPYVWAAGVNTDVETGRPPDGGFSNDTGFDDVLDVLDGVFELHAEGQGDEFGVLADFTYFGLADDTDHPRFRTETDLDARLFDLAAVWSPGAERYAGWEVFGGLRYIDLDFTVRFDPENPLFADTTLDPSQSYNDLLLGTRYTWPLSDNWRLSLRGDGSWGDTKGTWTATGVVQYEVSYGSWIFGYRHLDAEFEDDDDTAEVVLTGPVVGFGFTF